METLASISIAAGVILFSLWLCQRHRKQTEKKERARNTQTAQLKRAEQFRELEQELRTRVVARDVKSIGEMALDELILKLKSGELSPDWVLRAYQWRALEAQKKTNCVTECIAEAADLANHLQQKESDGLPLYGVPISVKDNIPMKGHVNSLGITSRLGCVDDEDAVLVQVLKAQGAVPFVRTTVPQLLMSHETRNAITGVTTHPLDDRRIPGGSSGGEGALIACGGSILGFGTDIGGSLRVPCHCCGICGLKTSSKRISTKGIPPRGQTILTTAWGPMARDVQSLVIAMRSLLVPLMFKLDKTVPCLPFQEQLYQDKKPMRIGFYTNDGYLSPSPAQCRGVRIAKTILEQQGHTLVEWTPPEVDFAMKIYAKSLSGDHGVTWRKVLGDDAVDSSIRFLLEVISSPWFRRKLEAWTATDKRYRDCVEAYAGASSVHDWWNWTADVELYRQRFEENWNSNGLDAVIAPSFLTTAPKHGCAKETILSVSFLMLYNAVDYPSGIVPVSRVTQEDIASLDSYENGGYLEDYVREMSVDTEGLPVTVQCAAPRWQEEVCLRVMKCIEDGVKQLENC